MAAPCEALETLITKLELDKSGFDKSIKDAESSVEDFNRGMVDSSAKAAKAIAGGIAVITSAAGAASGIITASSAAAVASALGAASAIAGVSKLISGINLPKVEMPEVKITPVNIKGLVTS